MKALSTFLTSILLCFIASNANAYTLEQMSGVLVRQLDRQVAMRLGQEDTPAEGISLFITTPVNLNNLEESNALSRQMQEDLAKGFAELGYNIQEIRKAITLNFDPEYGEILLTRDIERLSSTQATSNAVLTGTYTVTPKSVRFNIKMIQTNSLEVLAMASITVPINGDLITLVGGSNGATNAGVPIEPTVITRLP